MAAGQSDSAAVLGPCPRPNGLLSGALLALSSPLLALLASSPASRPRLFFSLLFPTSASPNAAFRATMAYFADNHSREVNELRILLRSYALRCHRALCPHRP